VIDLSNRRPYDGEVCDPHTCPIDGGHFKFASRADLMIYMHRVAQQRMEYAARHLMELGPGSELAKEIKKHHGAKFLDRLRNVARQLKGPA
jgi:hypothetical protein